MENNTNDTTGSTSIRPETKRLIERSDIKYYLGVLAKAIGSGSEGVEEIGHSFGNVDGNTIRRYVSKIDDFVESLNKSWEILRKRIIEYLDN